MSIVIYSKDSCPFCVKAKDLLQRNNKKFKELKLGVDFTREEILELFPSAKTFPIITIDGEWIGGYAQLEEIFNNLGPTT